MQSEVAKVRAQNKELPNYQVKIKFFETLIEDMSAENSRLILENQSLRRGRDTLRERDALKAMLDDFKQVNRRLMNDNEDLKHRYAVAEKLRLDVKE